MCVVSLAAMSMAALAEGSVNGTVAAVEHSYDVNVWIPLAAFHCPSREENVWHVFTWRAVLHVWRLHVYPLLHELQPDHGRFTLAIDYIATLHNRPTPRLPISQVAKPSYIGRRAGQSTSSAVRPMLHAFPFFAHEVVSNASL